MTHVNPVVNQTDFRGREDSGNEATPTWIDIANNNWSQDVDVDFRVRFVVAETAGADFTFDSDLWYSLNGGAFAAVTASTPIQFATFTGATDGDATTQQVGAGTFVAGELDSNDSVTGVVINNSETEMEYCLTIDSAQVANSNTLALRLYDAGTAIDTYTNEPTITVVEAANTNVLANTEALTLTTYQATISEDVDVQANTEALTLTTYQASVVLDQNVNVLANTEALTLTTNQATIAVDVDVQANTEALTLTTFQATVTATQDTEVAANTEALTLTTYAATVDVVSASTEVLANTEALTLTTFAATIGYEATASEKPTFGGWYEWVPNKKKEPEPEILDEIEELIEVAEETPQIEEVKEDLEAVRAAIVDASVARYVKGIAELAKSVQYLDEQLAQQLQMVENHIALQQQYDDEAAFLLMVA